MPRARKLVFLETFLAIQKRLSGVGVLNLSFQVSIDQIWNGLSRTRSDRTGVTLSVGLKVKIYGYGWWAI